MGRLDGRRLVLAHSLSRSSSLVRPSVGFEMESRTLFKLLYATGGNDGKRAREGRRLDKDEKEEEEDEKEEGNGGEGEGSRRAKMNYALS